MLLDRFLELLPGAFDDWNSSDVRPATQRFVQVLQKVPGMTTPNVLQLLNLAVGCLEPGEVYCEVGTYRGATLIGALLEQPGRHALAVDDFSLFDSGGTNHRALLDNLDAFGLRDRVRFFNQDFEAFFLGLRESEPSPIGVYLYDGGHDYRSQLLGLSHAIPFLADTALLIIDDRNTAAAQQAAWDFMALRPECRLLLDLPTPCNGHPSFWNGLYLLGWRRGTKNGYGADIFRRHRREELLRSLYAIQLAQLTVESGGVRMEPVEG